LHKKEVRYGGVRFDYAISSSSGMSGYLELKSAVFHDSTGNCMYPDVPSERGRRHLKMLEAIASQGMRAVMAFVAAHPLCRSFRPCDSCDPDFANLLRESRGRGVEVRAVGMALKTDGSTYLTSGDLPISLT
jgi:sugar fermentation stimulation protein A